MLLEVERFWIQIHLLAEAKQYVQAQTSSEKFAMLWHDALIVGTGDLVFSYLAYELTVGRYNVNWTMDI